MGGASASNCKQQGGTGREGREVRAHRGPGICHLFNEEVIQLARISLSAAFIKCGSRRAIRDVEESWRTSGMAGGSELGAWQGVKQIKREGHEKNKEKRKSKTGRQRRKSSTKRPR